MGLVINVGVVLESPEPITPSALTDALRKAGERHPFFRARLIKGEDSKWRLEERDAAMPLEECTHESGRPVGREEWQAQFLRFAALVKDFSASTVFAQLWTSRSESSLISCIFLSIHHCCIDGPGAFAAMHDLLSFLSDPSRPVTPLPLRDPCADLPIGKILSLDPPPVAVLMAEPQMAAKCEAPLAADQMDVATMSDDEKAIKGKFIAFTPEETTELLQRARKHAASVQALLTVVGLISVHKANRAMTEADPAAVKPTKAVAMLAYQMRPLLTYDPPVTSDECIVGGGGLWVSIDLADESASLWHLAADVKRQIQSETDSDGPLRFFRLLLNQDPFPKTTLFASSIGKTPVEGTYGPLTVRDALFVGGANIREHARPNVALHAFAAGGRMHVTVSYGPGYGKERIASFARCVEGALRACMEGDGVRVADVTF
ncbi:unnamed protein product [Vitrella brassicaformis CCMP3155]|uniref:Condensation domain-containing protein n=1 Tax=Vitrella brassicaformis (strain CCMP3155) TaxID=1169540 RepID=A0A0G4FF22_VITBC|nr:unnamed protein product [Vitrella brassicaformis CCMP3155]|eukprot:CEM11791.1 unnamed protein product [Vitrella brassicaformis CCMP3155]